jgi:hypothetical protein
MSRTYMGQLDGLVALVEEHAAHWWGVEATGVEGVQLGGKGGRKGERVIGVEEISYYRVTEGESE